AVARIARAEIEPIVHRFSASRDGDRNADGVFARRIEVAAEILRVNPIGAICRDGVDIGVWQPAIEELEVRAVMTSRIIAGVTQYIEWVAIFLVCAVGADDGAGNPSVRVPVPEVMTEFVGRDTPVEIALNPAPFCRYKAEAAPREADIGEGYDIEVIIVGAKSGRGGCGTSILQQIVRGTIRGIVRIVYVKGGRPRHPQHLRHILHGKLNLIVSVGSDERRHVVEVRLCIRLAERA